MTTEPQRNYTRLAIAIVIASLIFGSVAYLAISPVSRITTTASAPTITDTSTVTNTATQTQTSISERNSTTTSVITSTQVQTVTSETNYTITSTVSKTTTSYSTTTQTVTETVIGSATNSSSGQVGFWNPTTGYPFWPTALSCVSSGGYVYCVGGIDASILPNQGEEVNSTYFASLSATGVGPWTQSSDFPVSIASQSCVSSSGYIYCVGGYACSNVNCKDTATSYYAVLSSSGIGPWTQTTAFPYPAEPRCMVNSGFIYCATAQYNGSAYLGTGAIFSAPLSSDGVGSWTELTQLPKNPSGCSSNGGYGYCFGGGSCGLLNGSCPSTSYYALLSPNSSSIWNLTSDLQTSGYGPYVTADSYEYYFASPSVYFAHLSANGIGEWITTTVYPNSSNPSSCVANGLYLYCIGGSTSAVYFTRVNP